MNLKDAINAFYYDMTLNELRRMNSSKVFPTVSYNTLLYLDLIDMTENCTVSKLADILHISKSAVTIKMGELLKQNLVEKRRDETDKRIHCLTVNTAAVEEYRSYEGSLKRAIEKLEREYSKEEIRQFCTVLASFRQAYLKEEDNA